MRIRIVLFCLAGLTVTACDKEAGNSSAPSRNPAELVENFARKYVAASPDDAVPDEALREMVNLLLQRPAGNDEDSVQRRVENMDTVLAMGGALEKAFAHAANLSQVHRLMLQAADFLARARQDEASIAQVNTLVDRVLGDDTADAETKVTADFVRTMHRAQTAGQPAADAAKQIEAFVDRHKNTPSAGQAYGLGASLANQLKLTDLRAQYVKVLQENYMDDPAVLNYLRALKD